MNKSSLYSNPPKMSTEADWRIRKYWNKVGGLLIENYQIKSRKNKTENIDGIIVLNEAPQIATDTAYDFTGKDIIIVQAKKDYQGMQFLGRAFSSRESLMRLHPHTIKTVAICHEHDEEMYRLCHEFAIEMEVITEL